jgi:hypothetical protein
MAALARFISASGFGHPYTETDNMIANTLKAISLILPLFTV